MPIIIIIIIIIDFLLECLLLLYTVSTNNAVQVGVLHFLTLYDCLDSSRVDQLCTVKSPTEKKQNKKSKKLETTKTLFTLHSQLISQKSVSLVTSIISHI